MINYCIDNKQYKKKTEQYTITKSELAIFIGLIIPEKKKYIYISNKLTTQMNIWTLSKNTQI